MLLKQRFWVVKYGWVLSLLILCNACGSSPERKFEKQGVSFTCPAGWKITEEEEIEDDGYYLIAEEEGLSASGLVFITWLNGAADLDEMLFLYQEELKKNIIHRYSNLQFKPPVEATFNGVNALVSHYRFSLLTVKHEGSMYCFYENGKTIVVGKQQAIEDREKNQKGFELIEKSFKVE